MWSTDKSLIVHDLLSFYYGALAQFLMVYYQLGLVQSLYVTWNGGSLGGDRYRHVLGRTLLWWFSLKLMSGILVDTGHFGLTISGPHTSCRFSL